MKWLLVLLVACGGQPARTKQVSQYVIGGSLVGVLGASVVMLAAPSAKTAMTFTIAGFGAIAVGGTVAYVRADLEEPPHAFTPAEQQRIAAWDLTKQAAAAARQADCAKVRELSRRVAALDADFHASVFVRDVAIARCLK